MFLLLPRKNSSPLIASIVQSPPFFFLMHTSPFPMPAVALTASMEADSIAESSTVHEVTIDIPTDPEPQGYDRLATFMGLLPEAAIFRRFAALNAKNILYLQAELLSLEQELQSAAEDDARSTSAKRQEYSRDWYLLSRTGDHSDGDPQQWKLFMTIRNTLNEYSAHHLNLNGHR